LVLIAVEYVKDNAVYMTQNLSQRDAMPGPGEGFPLQSISLQFEGVIRAEGTLLRQVLPSFSTQTLIIFYSVSPRKRHIVFSTKNPASVQRIAWPSYDSDEQDDSASIYKRQIGNENWLINDDDFPWLVESEGKCLSPL
jgi:hypothetical protein